MAAFILVLMSYICIQNAAQFTAQRLRRGSTSFDVGVCFLNVKIEAEKKLTKRRSEGRRTFACVRTETTHICQSALSGPVINEPTAHCNKSAHLKHNTGTLFPLSSASYLSASTSPPVNKVIILKEINPRRRRKKTWAQSRKVAQSLHRK